MLTESLAMWAGVVLLALVAVLWAALLRWAKAPGWGVLGGLLAGFFLGPTILGRTLPATYEWLYVGGAEARDALIQKQHEHERFRVALSEAGTSAEAMQAVLADQEKEIAPLRAAVDRSREQDKQPMLAFTIVTVAGLLISTGLVGVPRSEHKHSFASPLNIGAWAAVVPGSLAAILLWWGDEPVNTCIAAASTLMIGPWALTNVDRRSADEVELGGAQMIQNAGRVASALAIAAWLGALVAIGGLPLMLMGTPIAALALGWFAPTITGHWLRRAYEHSAVPMVVACAAIRVDFINDLAFWPVLMFLILSGDGRWIGAVIGATAIGGRRGVRSMRLVLGSMACGPTQAAIAAMAIHLEVLPAKLVMAALLGAALIEVATPMRRKLAYRLAQTELEIDEILEED